MCFVAPASAEVLLDLYGGAALTASGKVTARRDTTGASERVNFDAGPSVGIRGGYWWQYVGLSLDVYYFAPDPEATTRTALVEGPTFFGTPSPSLEVTAIGLNLMGRWPLMDRRVQPYGYLGPAIFMSEFEWRLLFGTTGSDRDTTVGLHAGVGLAVMAGKHVGAFAEYRFTHFSAEHRVDDLRLDGDVSTHHLLVGITFRF